MSLFLMNHGAPVMVLRIYRRRRLVCAAKHQGAGAYVSERRPDDNPVNV